MTKTEATKMAKELVEEYGQLPFQISMPDKESYDIMRSAFAELGRPSGPDGEFFVIKIFEQGVQ